MSSDNSSEDDDRRTSVYESARAALAAILRAERAREHAWFLQLSGQWSVTIDWPEAAKTIVSGTDDLPLDIESFWILDKALDQAPDRTAADEIRQIAHTWANANWPLIEEKAREEALNIFIKVNYAFEHNFPSYIKRWPQLRNDVRLLSSAINSLKHGAPRADAGVGQLRALRGDSAAAARVLATVMAARSTFKERDELASLIAEWAGDSPWGQLQHLLWRKGATQPCRSPAVIPEPAASVVQAAVLLEELGLTITAEPPYRLAELSPETRASWRHELRTAIGDDAALKIAVTEALLWLGSAHDDRAVLFAVLDLHKSSDLDALMPLRSHSDRLVRRRAAAIIDLANGVPDAIELLRSAERATQAETRLVADGLGPARTWIADARIERLIENALDEAARNFGATVRRTRASGEETHVAILFDRLATAFARINHRLALYAAETEANERLEIRMEHRILLISTES